MTTFTYIVAGVIICLLFLLSPAGATAQEYELGEGDLIRITIYDNPDLTTEVRVSGEGKITVPLIGDVQVRSLTGRAVGKKLADLYADGYLRNPQVSVFILEYKSRKVTALGEFNKPGLIEMRGNSTLMEVISSAGGITANAGDMLYIQRNTVKNGANHGDKADQKGEITISIDLVRLLEVGDAALNVPVLDSDSIYVPRASFVYVTGEVRNAGAFKITKGLTVLRSITLAGGFTQKASRKGTKIVRKTGKAETTIPALMDALVQPDDIIVVPESFF